jgi:hypothetical protein
LEKKSRAAKKKGPLIRDLNKISLDDLAPDQTHLIMGGAVYSCGGPGDECSQLEVIVSAQKLKIEIVTKARARIMR